VLPLRGNGEELPAADLKPTGIATPASGRGFESLNRGRDQIA
jgi:hypothetical protein